MTACGKVRFTTRAKADAALLQIRKQGERRAAGKKPVRSYACPHCNGWHLTSEAR